MRAASILSPAYTTDLALIRQIFSELPNLAYIGETWVLAHDRVESGGDAGAVGGSGSLGLLQVIPTTAEQMGETGSQLDAKTSLRTGIKYMDFCARDIIAKWNAKYGGNINSVARSAVVEAFNEGQAAVEAGKRDDAYWDKVYAAWMIFSAQVSAVQILTTHVIPPTPSAHLIVTP
jgi:soluble lytic murein transglycosylase-like protein